MRGGRSVFIVPALLAVAAQAAAAQSSSEAAQPLGQRLVAQHCGVCHSKPLLESGRYGPVLSRETVDGKEDAVRGFIAAGTERMPGFRYTLDPGEIDAIVQYLKTVPAPAAAPASGKRPGAFGAPGGD